MDKLITIQQVSAATGVPVGTLRHWRSLGKGPRAARIGRRVVYRAADVEAWVDAQFSRADGPA